MINPAFIVHIEGNKNKGDGESQPNKMLEQESIKCFSLWRKLGGIYKDIPIYAICHTGNTPTDNTLDEYCNLGVTYIEQYIPDVKLFPAGWWATPLMGKWAEENLDHDFFIHTDVDMNLIRKVTSEFIYTDPKYLAKCAVYSRDFPDDKRIDPRFDKTFVTCFITSWSHNKFYTKWYNKQMELEKIWDKSDRWSYCNLEEHAVDVLHYEDGYDIEKVYKCQIGEDQGYDTLASLTDDELKEVFFLHNHYDNDATRVVIEYMRRMKYVGL